MGCLAFIIIIVSFCLWVARSKSPSPCGLGGKKDEESGGGESTAVETVEEIKGDDSTDSLGGGNGYEVQVEQRTLRRDDKSSPRMGSLQKHESLKFDVSKFSVARKLEERVDPDAITGLAGRGILTAPTPFNSPVPKLPKAKDWEISGGRVVRTPVLDGAEDDEGGVTLLDDTPTKQPRRKVAAEGGDSSPLPYSLTVGRPPSTNWPFVTNTITEEEISPEAATTETPYTRTTGQERLSMTFAAAPGYTSPSYTPSKYQPSPPTDSDDVNNAAGLSRDSWPLHSVSPTPAQPSPLELQDKAQDEDEKTEYHPSPPPTLPNTARPLSLVQEYSLAAFPTSPCPPGTIPPPPQSPSQQSQLESAVEYALDAMASGGTTTSNGVSSPATTTTLPSETSTQPPATMPQERRGAIVPSPMPSPLLSPHDSATASIAEDEKNDKPLPLRPRGGSCNWSEKSMENLLLQASRRDSAREREREEDENSNTTPVVGGFAALKKTRTTSFSGFPSRSRTDSGAVMCVEEDEKESEEVIKGPRERKNATASEESDPNINKAQLRMDRLDSRGPSSAKYGESCAGQ